MNPESGGVMICSGTSFFATVLFTSLEPNKKLVRTEEQIQHSSFCSGDQWIRAKALVFLVIKLDLPSLRLQNTLGKVQFTSSRQLERMWILLVQVAKSQQISYLYINGVLKNTSPCSLLVFHLVLHAQFNFWRLLRHACIQLLIFLHQPPLAHNQVLELSSILGLKLLPLSNMSNKNLCISAKEERAPFHAGLNASNCWWEIEEGIRSAKDYRTV